jgi:dTMP kinase
MKYHLQLDLEFKKNPFKGIYIALEGIDGSGKTTQAKALQKYFEKKKKVVTMTSEPRVDLPGGEQIMQFFRGEISVSGQAFQYWMSANRVINHDTIVTPALENKGVVISDRCFWSAIPYGLMDRGVNFQRNETERMLVTQSVLSHYHQFIVPDIVFYIDIGSKVGLERSLAKKERRENDVYEKKEKLEKVVKGYRWLVKEFASEFVVIDGEKPMEEVTEQIIDRVVSSE